MATLTDDLKKTAVDTGYVVVGITDLAVERVRDAQTRAAEVSNGVRNELKADRLQAKAAAIPSHAMGLPTSAVSKGLEAAGKVEDGFDDLAARGKKLVERIRKQRATQDLVSQGKATLTRSKAAVTTVRRGAKDTQTSAKATVTVATREAEKTVAATKRTVAKRADATKPAVKRTATTASKRTAASKTASKGAVTSTRKTATKAVKAVSAAADKVGD